METINGTEEINMMVKSKFLNSQNAIFKRWHFIVYNHNNKISHLS